MQRQASLVLILTILLGSLLIIGLSAIAMQPLYSNQTSLSVSYNDFFGSNSSRSARFSNPQGEEIAFFTVIFQNTNHSQGPVVMYVEFGPNPGVVYLDSLRLTFTSDSLSWPVIGWKVPSAGTLFPTQITREEQQQVVIEYQDLGWYGRSTNGADLWFGLVSPASYDERTVFLKVQMTAHVPGTVLMGQSYSGEASFKIIVESNGLIYVSD